MPIFFQPSVAQSQEYTAAKIPYYQIAGGSRGGGLSAFIGQLDTTLDNLEIELVATRGGADNLERLQEAAACSAANEILDCSDIDSDLFFTLAQVDVAYHAHTGQYGFEENKEFEAVLPLTLAYQQIFVRADSDINEFADLRGKTVASGAMNSASLINFRDVLDEAGFDHGPDSVDTDLAITTLQLGSGLGLAILELCGGNPYACKTSLDSALPQDCDYYGGSLNAREGERARIQRALQLIRDAGCVDNPASCRIDAVAVTGSARTRPGLKHIAVPLAVLAAVSRDVTYYPVSEAPDSLIAEINGSNVRWSTSESSVTGVY
jgi:hypothetical protein